MSKKNKRFKDGRKKLIKVESFKEPSFRFKYVAYTSKVLDKFLNWVNSFGFEKTHLGQILSKLDKIFYIRKSALFFLYSFLLSLILFYEFDSIPKLKVGEVAVSDIKSKFSFQYVDEVSTELKRTQAEESTPLIFDYDPNVYEKVYESLYESFGIMREEISKTKWPRKLSPEKIKSFLPKRPLFEESLGQPVSIRIFEWLVEKRFSARIENAIVAHFEEWSEKKTQDSSSFIEESINESDYLKKYYLRRRNQFSKISNFRYKKRRISISICEQFENKVFV